MGHSNLSQKIDLVRDVDLRKLSEVTPSKRLRGFRSPDLRRQLVQIHPSCRSCSGATPADASALGVGTAVLVRPSRIWQLEYPHDWQWAQPFSCTSCAPQSGQMPMNSSRAEWSLLPAASPFVGRAMPTSGIGSDPLATPALGANFNVC